MAYGSITDLQDLIAQFTIGASSKPNTTQATAIIADISNEIDVALTSVGVTVPVTTPAYFLDWLGRLNAYGAAAAVLKSMFPDATGPGDTPAYAFWNDWYQRGLATILDGSVVPTVIVTPGSGTFVLPETYLTRNADEELATGDIAEPLFKMGKIY